MLVHGAWLLPCADSFLTLKAGCWLTLLASLLLRADAFLTFKDLLTRHKSMVAQFLSEHYDDFFLQYTTLLQSDNYVTRRQSLKVCMLCLVEGCRRTAGQAQRGGWLSVWRGSA